MKTIFALLCVIGQVGVLGFMAGEREYVLRHGETVYLRTAPIDPRDVFRGDFVRLTYEAALVPPDKWQGDSEVETLRTGAKVYAALDLGPQGLAKVRSLSGSPPADGPYLRGRVVYNYGGRRTGPIRVKYGLEQFFVQQGKGLEIEKRRGRRDDLQIPMEMEIAIGPRGTSVIAGYRWSRLGIALEVVRAPARQRRGVTPDPDEPLSPKLRITLANVSQSPLTLANPGADCGFELVAVQTSGPGYVPVARGCATATPGIGEIHRLAPGDSYSAEIDLSEPRWHMTKGDKTGEIGMLARWERFRLVYRSPDGYGPGGDARIEALWRGRLASGAFNASGRID